MSSHVLKISKDRDSRTSPGNLLQRAITRLLPSVQNQFQCKSKQHRKEETKHQRLMATLFSYKGRLQSTWRKDTTSSDWEGGYGKKHLETSSLPCQCQSKLTHKTCDSISQSNKPHTQGRNGFCDFQRGSQQGG